MSIIKNVMLYGEQTDIEYNDEGIIVSVQKSKDISESKYHIYPALFDIHCHGMLGLDASDGEGIDEMSRYMLSRGVVDWCPTTMTLGMDQIKNATKKLPVCKDGANVVGYHLEGPYINVKYKGAQNPDYIKNPDIKEFEAVDNVATVTIAPETEGAMEFIKNSKVPVCLGHTDCDYDTALEAIGNGAACLTHTFNAMPPIHHRNPGPIGAAAEKGIYAQVICDGFHIHKAAILMLYKLFGSDRMILISDNVRPAGLPDGDYNCGGLDVTVKNGEARLTDGTIAGSTTCLFDCVKKAIEFGIPEKEAFKMASETPYNMFGMKKGKIAPGYPADFILTDTDKNIKSVVKNGTKYDY